MSVVERAVDEQLRRQRSKGNTKPEEELRAELEEAIRQRRRRGRKRRRQVDRLTAQLAEVDPVSSRGARRAIARRLLTSTSETER